MKTSRILLSPLMLLLFLLSTSSLLYSQKDVEIEPYSKIEGKLIFNAKPDDKVKELHDSSGVAVFLINKGTGLVAVAKKVFEKLNTNKISVFVTNDELEESKYDFTETSVSLNDRETYFNLEKYLDEKGKGKFRLVLEKAMNKVFILKGN